MAKFEFALEPWLTSLQIALTEALWEAGIRPGVVAGRSAGEFAAGYAQGALSHHQALDLAVRVSRMISSGRTAGRVILVPASAEQSDALAAASPVPFHFVADNRADGTYVACAESDLEALLVFMRSRGLVCRVEPMGVAAHSPLMDAYARDFLQPFASGGHKHSRVASYSSVTGARNDGRTLDLEYWWASIRQPVQVRTMFQRMISDGCRVFVEIGGRSSFGPLLQEAAAMVHREIVVIATMTVAESPAVSIPRAVGRIREACGESHAPA
jgi:acyl transferase domain-containing protein